MLDAREWQLDLRKPRFFWLLADHCRRGLSTVVLQGPIPLTLISQTQSRHRLRGHITSLSGGWEGDRMKMGKSVTGDEAPGVPNAI